MLLLLLLAFGPLSAQPALEWEQTLGGSQQEELALVQQTRDGGYVLGGSSESPASGDKTEFSRGGLDFWVVKLDAAGHKQWDKTLGGSGRDGLAFLQQTSDGGYIVGGTSNSPAGGDKSQASKGGEDFWLVRLDANGHKVWDRTLGGSGTDRLAGLQQTSDGGYIVGGTSNSPAGADKSQSSKGGDDYWLVRLNASGNKVWDKTIGGSAGDRLASLVQASDGGFILGGTSDSPAGADKTGRNFDEGTLGRGDYWVVKLNGSGSKQWDKTYGGSGFDVLRSLRPSGDGGFILGGNSNSPPNSGNKTAGQLCPDPDWVHTSFAWVVKLDAAGHKLWDQIYGDCIDDEAESADVLVALVATPDGGYLLGGSTATDACDQDGCREAYWLVKLDGQGGEQWQQRLNAEYNEFLTDLLPARDGGYFVGGNSNSPAGDVKTEPNRGGCEGGADGSPPPCTYDYWVVKLAPLPPGGQLQGFTLINTASEQPIRSLPDGDALNLVDLPAGKLNIRANTVPVQVGSVRFSLSGRQSRTYADSEVPYALFGDIRGDYNKWSPPPGNYTLQATPFSGKNGTGVAGTPLTIHFTVIYREPLTRLQIFSLINTESEQPIRLLTEGDEIILSALPTRKLNIGALTDPAQVGSVKFRLRGRQSRTYTDNKAPYALFGDTRGDYNKWYPPPGSYTLTATPYFRPDGQGRAGTPLTIHFRVEELGSQAVVQWDKTLGGNGDELSTTIQQTRDGGYILGGFSLSGISGEKTGGNRGDFDYWVVKLDPGGKKVWDKTFGGEQRDDLLCVQQTRDGGYILGGHSESGKGGDRSQTSRGAFDFWVLKLDAAGNKQWDRRFGGDSYDLLSWLEQTRDGGYILGGTSYSGKSGDKSEAGRGDSDYWLVKIDASGHKQWDKAFGGSLRDALSSLRQTSDGGYVLGGISDSPAGGDKTQAPQAGTIDYWVLKLDRSGNKQWDKTLGGAGEDIFSSLQQTTNGGYILGGGSDSGVSGDKTQASRGDQDYWVVKLNAAGEKVWDKTYGSTTTDYFASLQQTSDGGYLLGGSAEPAGAGGDKTEPAKGSGDYWLVKLDEAGNKVWDKTIGGSFFDGLTCVRQTRDGGYVLLGWSDSPIGGDKTGPGRGSWDYWVVKLAPFLEGQREARVTLADTQSEQLLHLLQEGAQARVFPNPSSDGRFQVRLAGPVEGRLNYALLSAVGRKLAEGSLNLAERAQVLDFDFSSRLPAAGVYYLRLEAAQGQQVFRILYR